MPKLTYDAYEALMRKPGTYQAFHRTDEDWLQLIAQALRAYEADDMTADEAMEAIGDTVILWLPHHLERLRDAANRTGDGDGEPRLTHAHLSSLTDNLVSVSRSNTLPVTGNRRGRVMDAQPVKRSRGRSKTGTAQDGAARQMAYERCKKDQAMTMAATLHLLARDDDEIPCRLDLPTLEAMRDSLTLTGKAGRDVEAWIASVTENQPSPAIG